MVDPPGQPESPARSTQVHPDDADPHRRQAYPQPDHIRRLGAARQPVDQHGRRPRAVPPGWRRFQHQQPVPVGQRDLVVAGVQPRPGQRPVPPRDRLRHAAPRSQGGGSNGGKSAMSSVPSMTPGFFVVISMASNRLAARASSGPGIEGSRLETRDLTFGGHPPFHPTGPRWRNLPPSPSRLRRQGPVIRRFIDPGQDQVQFSRGHGNGHLAPGRVAGRIPHEERGYGTQAALEQDQLPG